MITYESGGKHFLLNVFRVHGSVFPKAMVVSLPCALLTALLEWASRNLEAFKHLRNDEEIMTNSQAWAGFSFLVGFLVVFRTSQAYSRFWEGLTAMHMMRSRWLDAASALLAFCKYSEANSDRVTTFESLLIRLYSMLHAAALADIEDCGDGMAAQTQAFSMELIDPAAIDAESLRTVRDSDMKVELIFQWLQQLIVENIKTGVLSIPAPILTRTFGEMATGLVYFNEALKISTVPFPFPYAQTCDVMLILQFFLVPVIFMQWVTNPFWAASLTFVQVFPLWALNLIAVELENPFGSDPNDADCPQMQKEFNKCMRMLVASKTTRTPRLVDRSPSDFVARVKAETEGTIESFETVWQQMLDATERDSGADKRTHLTERRYTNLKQRLTQNSSSTLRSTMQGQTTPRWRSFLSYQESSLSRSTPTGLKKARSAGSLSASSRSLPNDDALSLSSPTGASHSGATPREYVVSRNQHAAMVLKATERREGSLVLNGTSTDVGRLKAASEAPPGPHGSPLLPAPMEEEIQVTKRWEPLPLDVAALSPRTPSPRHRGQQGIVRSRSNSRISLI
mmetsp:Transcript_58940/g.108894  ORF Transcript_58940/g.108894 Transcript_58940/m.108894 type:complete len:567 (-) Transcript_58940:103-1803(-)